MFGRSKKPPKDENSLKYKMWMANKLHGKKVRYVIERGDDNIDKIIGKTGFLNLFGDEFSVICGENTLFTVKVANLKAWEFMSLEGASLTGFDLTQGKERTIHAFYKYYRD